MNNTVISVEHLTKQYDLGVISTGTLTRDLERWWARVRKQPDPYSTIGQRDAFERIGETILALDDVSFTVEKGEALGIIGKNGAGKSTLLKILSRVTAPTSGVVKVKGRIGSLLEVGTGFHPELTGRENVYLNGAILGMKKAEVARKFDEIVAFSGVEKFIDTPVKRYSSGMYVRLAFAVAAHLDPDILIVDEVLAVGDAEFQKKCLGKMGDVAGEGRTVLFVSHNMGAISQLCKNALLLQDGKLIKRAQSIELIEYYLTNHKTSIASRRWAYPGDALGDNRVRLISCSVSQDGKCNSIININTKTIISIEFMVLQPVVNLVSGINLYTNEDLCILANCDWRENAYSPGIYKKEVEIPEHFLAEGQINLLVQIIFYDPDIRSVVLPHALFFEAIDSNHQDSVRGPYKGRWPGIIRPKLKWSFPKQISLLKENDS